MNWEPKIIAFLCNWCSYAGADLAGVSRLQYPANVKIIKVPCSGRISPELILNAFHKGADGVWVSGCHIGDCHYISGNMYARRRLILLKRLLEFAGLEPERLHLSWISASEGEKFAEHARKITEDIKRLGPNLRFGRKKF